MKDCHGLGGLSDTPLCPFDNYGLDMLSLLSQPLAVIFVTTLPAIEAGAHSYSCFTMAASRVPRLLPWQEPYPCRLQHGSPR